MVNNSLNVTIFVIVVADYTNKRHMLSIIKL